MSASHFARSIVILLCGALAAFGCVGTDTEQSESGALSLNLVLAGDIEIDVVDWQITGNGMDMGGSVDVSAPGSTASVEVFGLPVGQEPYVVELSAVSVDQQVTCRGSAEFDVEVGVSTPVMVILNCKLPQELGGVRVNGKFNICAQLTKMVVAPLQTSVGNDISLFSTASDEEGDPITYMWSSHSGSIADPMAASTTYTCTEAGDDDITVLVTDDDGSYCMSMWTVRVTCVLGDGNPCDDITCEDDGNECTSEACNPSTGACESSPVDDGTSCEDATGVCMNGECVPNDLCEGVVCDDLGECLTNVCNPGTGLCVEGKLPDDTECENGAGVCMDGLCAITNACEGVVCEDDGNECTAAECNPGTGLCETSNVDDATACNDDTGTCNEGVCEPNPECVVPADCLNTGNECVDAVCDAGTCGTSNNTNACDGGNGTCDGQGNCVTNPECAVSVDCPPTGNECIDPVCNAGVCETSNNTNACDGGAGTCDAGECVPNVEVVYFQDFNQLDITGGVIGDGWVYFINAFATPPYDYSGPAPNGPQICALVDDQGGAEQEPQQLSVYSDYNNADHGNGVLIETNVFQEPFGFNNRIPQSEVGKTYTFSFQAKQGNIGGSSTANAFIKTLDPNAGFSVSDIDVVDTTAIGSTWTGYTLTLDITDDRVGDILQFGFQTNATNFEPSGNFYDNVLVTK